MGFFQTPLLMHLYVQILYIHVSQRLLSVRPHYAESDYKMSSHVHGVRSAIRPRMFVHLFFLQFILVNGKYTKMFL